MMRAYTVKEIDDLRAAVEQRWLYGSCVDFGRGFSRVYSASEKEQSVETILRTHMIAGHTAQDLIDADSDLT